MSNVQKAIAITDAKISFVSLVDKAANKKQFLITKAKDGNAEFSTYGRIVKTDPDRHYVTGIVYEPLVEDAHGNFMTEDEITKAAYWFAKNGDGVDLQHSFETLEKAEVVESWIAKADFDCGEETVKKGTWLMTVEVTDEDVWDAVQKGELTGFSMGGVGKYDTEDTDLNTEVEKGEAPAETEQTAEKGFFKKLAKFFGFEVVEKGAVKDLYEERIKREKFWNALWALEDTLYRYDWYTEEAVYESDEEKIREALADFNEIITELLTGDGIAKSLAVTKAGKKMSAKNKQTLTSIYENLGAFLSEVDDSTTEETEETEMTKADVEKIVADAIAKANTPASDGNPEAPAAAETPAPAPELTQETVEKMVADAVAKALAPQEEQVTAENIGEIVDKAVKKAIEPILKARALPSALNDGNGDVQKNEPHYLAGIL